MYGSLSDKSDKYLAEVLSILTKSAYSQEAPTYGWGDRLGAVGDTIQNVDYANAGVQGARGAKGAYDAVKGGQGITAAGRAFAAPFSVPRALPSATTGAAQAAGKLGTLGKVGLGTGLALSAVDTYGNVKNQMNNSQAYKGTGRSYMGSEEGLWDTLSTAGAAAPLVGAGVGAAVGGGVGAVPGMAIGYGVQGAVAAGKWVGQGLTGFDPDKMRAARASVKGQGYNNASDFTLDGLGQDQNGSGDEFESTSWFGNKRNFKTEQLNNYLQQERTNNRRSQTNKGQVA